MYRLTVHVTGVSRVDTQSPKQFKRKKQQTAVEAAMEKRSPSFGSAKGRFKIFNTLSFVCKTKEEINQKLSYVRSKYEIKIGDDKNKPNKFGKELYSISFVK